jgi:hypothetical protein
MTRLYRRSRAMSMKTVHDEIRSAGARKSSV